MSNPMEARQSQVGFVRSPVMLLGDDVIDLKSEPIQNRQQAVFATVAGTQPNQLFEFAIHHSAHAEALRRKSLALDFINSTKHPTWR